MVIPEFTVGMLSTLAKIETRDTALQGVLKQIESKVRPLSSGSVDMLPTDPMGRCVLVWLECGDKPEETEKQLQTRLGPVGYSVTSPSAVFWATNSTGGRSTYLRLVLVRTA